MGATAESLSLHIKTSWGCHSPPAWAAKPTAEHLHKNLGATSQQVPAAQKSPCNSSWCKNTWLTEVTISGSPAKPHKGLPPPSPPQNLPVNIKGHTGMLLSQVQLCSETGLILMWVILGFGQGRWEASQPAARGGREEATAPVSTLLGTRGRNKQG